MFRHVSLKLKFNQFFFLIMAAYILFDSLWNYLFNNIFCFGKEFINFSYYTGTFLVGAHLFWVPFPKLQTFSEKLWVLSIDYSLYEKTILGVLFICSFAKLQRQKKISVFTNNAVKLQHVLFANKPFLRKMLI